MKSVMSTNIVGDSLNTGVNLSIIVGNVKEKLSDYIRRIRNEKSLSTTDVERLSGFTITDGYVSRIENNGVKNVSPEKLKALAKGLGVPEYEILTVAGFKNSFTPESDPLLAEISVFFSGYEDLSDKNRSEMKPFLMMLATEIKRRLFEEKDKKK